MNYLQILIDTPFYHGRRLLQNTKLQKIGFVPNGDRFNKSSGGEITFSNCTNSVSINFRMRWICNSRREKKFGWLVNFAKCY